MPHVGVKGKLEAGECVLFGLRQGDLREVQGRLSLWGHRVGQDGHQVAQSPLTVVSLLTDHLGYTLVTTAQGQHETVVFTLHKPFQRQRPYYQRY